MKISKKYTSELRDHFGYLATWFPGVPLKLGDIGIIRNRHFTRISSLKEKGISFKIRKDNTPMDIEYISSGGVSVSMKAAGALAPANSSLSKADAGLIVQFSEENAILFKANGTTTPSIENVLGLGETVLDLYRKGEWEKDWVIITELVKAKSATVLISNSSNSKLELKASGNTKSGKIDIASADAKLNLAFSHDLATQMIATTSLTPLFKASKVKGRLFFPPIFETQGVRMTDLITPAMAKENKECVYFDNANYSDLEMQTPFIE